MRREGNIFHRTQLLASVMTCYASCHPITSYRLHTALGPTSGSDPGRISVPVLRRIPSIGNLISPNPIQMAGAVPQTGNIQYANAYTTTGMSELPVSAKACTDTPLTEFSVTAMERQCAADATTIDNKELTVDKFLLLGADHQTFS